MNFLKKKIVFNYFNLLHISNSRFKYALKYSK